MKVGNRVKVTELMDLDIGKSNVEVGDEGVITNPGSWNNEVFYVKFDKVIEAKDNDNLYEDGTYTMFIWQLEVI